MNIFMLHVFEKLDDNMHETIQIGTVNRIKRMLTRLLP